MLNREASCRREIESALKAIGKTTETAATLEHAADEFEAHAGRPGAADVLIARAAALLRAADIATIGALRDCAAAARTVHAFANTAIDDHACAQMRRDLCRAGFYEALDHPGYLRRIAETGTAGLVRVDGRFYDLTKHG
jgi:hypothetical protein